MYKALSERYLATGGLVEGTTEAFAEFDYRLFCDLVGGYQFEVGQYETLYQNYPELELIGKDLSYAHAGSFVAHLADKYGWTAVLEAYETQDIEGVFGKDYETLKADWLAYLTGQY